MKQTHFPIIILSIITVSGCAMIPLDGGQDIPDSFWEQDSLYRSQSSATRSPAGNTAQAAEESSEPGFFDSLFGSETDSDSGSSWSSAAESHSPRRRRSRADELSDRGPDVTLGMSSQQVYSVWGEPADIETAGDPRYGNQRWIYYLGLSSPWSMRQARVVYFEQGRVVGWETTSR